MNKQSRVDGDDPDLPAAARIRARLQRVANINPAQLLKYCEKAELDPFTISGRATMALLEELVATGAIPSGEGGFD